MIFYNRTTTPFCSATSGGSIQRNSHRRSGTVSATAPPSMSICIRKNGFAARISCSGSTILLWTGSKRKAIRIVRGSPGLCGGCIRSSGRSGSGTIQPNFAAIPSAPTWIYRRVNSLMPRRHVCRLLTTTGLSASPISPGNSPSRITACSPNCSLRP